MRGGPIWSFVACVLAFTVSCGGDDAPPIGDAGGGFDAAGDAGVLPDGAARGCGDGLVRPPEACDDGNTTDGDGCSADCSSDETCGNGALDTIAGELCDDMNTDDGDGCRGDCLSDYRCGNDVVDTIASGAAADEVCDDGNTVNGDGCNASCDSDESCGNSVVDLGAGEVCDDGNTMDGDDCSADCRTSLLCGNGDIDGAEECDDGGTDDGDGCSATCLVERCGNGRVDAGEDCDDANADDTDGCTMDCSFTCSAPADCADADVCNGDETCTDPATTMSRCAPGTAAIDGTSCGAAGRVCMGGVCTVAGCGDGTVTAPEDCDDGNTTDADGCDADCTWTCTRAADCSDGLVCNGAERCTRPSTLMSRCVAGAARADGTTCDRDAMPRTRDVCRMAMCFASVCGDGFVDAGATPVEQCDDGNSMSGDGCSSTCTTEMAVPPTGFRLTNLDLISPRIVADIILFGCRDVTQTPVLGFSVNGALDTAIQPMSSGGDYGLHIVDVMRPLNPAAASTPTELHLDAVCNETPTPDACMADPMPDPVLSNANNQSVGNCFTPVAADVNTRVGTPAAYAPTANTVSAPCFVSDEESLTVTLSGIEIPLERARVAATYSGSPATRFVSGVVIGFLSETAAADVILPMDLPVVGGDSLYEHLQAGNRSVVDSAGTTIPDACNVGGGMSEDDADMDGATRGFWFYLNFEAELITWSEP